MKVNQAEEKAYQAAKDYARKTDRPETFWLQLFEDIKRKKRLIELDRVKRSFNDGR